VGLRVQGRVGRTHYCARPPQNRTRDFHRIRLKQEGGSVTGPAADARGCCRWVLPGFGHDHAVGAALLVLDLSALSASAVRAPAMAVWTAGSWAGWWPRSVLRLI